MECEMRAFAERRAPAAAWPPAASSVVRTAGRCGARRCVAPATAGPRCSWRYLRTQGAAGISAEEIAAGRFQVEPVDEFDELGRMAAYRHRRLLFHVLEDLVEQRS